MWEIQPFLPRNYNTIHSSPTVLNCLDYVNWCRTSKTTWTPIDLLFGGNHMKEFLDGCTSRNKTSYYLTPHAKTYEQLRLLATLTQTCFIVQETLFQMRGVRKFDFSPVMIKASTILLQLQPNNTFGYIDIESFNFAYAYIKTKYGWYISLNKINQLSNVNFPLSHKIQFLSDSCSVSVVPCFDL